MVYFEITEMDGNINISHDKLFEIFENLSSDNESIIGDGSDF